jgi:hypothetical protein
VELLSGIELLFWGRVGITWSQRENSVFHADVSPLVGFFPPFLYRHYIMQSCPLETSKGSERSGRAKHAAEVIAVLSVLNAVVQSSFQCVLMSCLSCMVKSVSGVAMVAK